MLDKVREWVSKLPESERNKPIIYYRGRFWTPNEILKEVEAGSEIGEELQNLLEKIVGVLPYSNIELSKHELQIMLDKVAKKRLIEKLREYMKVFGNQPILVTLGIRGRKYTISDLIKLISEDKGIGKELIEAEKIKLIKLLMLYR